MLTLIQRQEVRDRIYKVNADTVGFHGAAPPPPPPPYRLRPDHPEPDFILSQLRGTQASIPSAPTLLFKKRGLISEDRAHHIQSFKSISTRFNIAKRSVTSLVFTMSRSQDQEQTRPASHAGSWYEKNPKRLSSELDDNLSKVPDTLNGSSLPIPGARVIIGPSVSPLHSSCFSLSQERTLTLVISQQTCWLQILRPVCSMGVQGS